MSKKELYNITINSINTTYCDMPIDVADLVIRLLDKLKVDYCVSYQHYRTKDYLKGK